LQSFADNRLGCTSLSWCTGRFEPPTLVAAGSGGHLQIFRYSDVARAWQPLLQLQPTSPQDGGGGGSNSNTCGGGGGRGGGREVLDVAWAPNVGRSFHYIASAEGDHLRVYRLSRRGNRSSPDGGSNKGGGDKHPLTLESCQTLNTNSAWTCQWNVTGTVLASSGDAGIVQLWKAGRDGQFVCVSKIQGDVTKVAAAASAAAMANNGGEMMMET